MNPILVVNSISIKFLLKSMHHTSVKSLVEHIFCNGLRKCADNLSLSNREWLVFVRNFAQSEQFILNSKIFGLENHQLQTQNKPLSSVFVSFQVVHAKLLHDDDLEIWIDEGFVRLSLENGDKHFYGLNSNIVNFTRKIALHDRNHPLTDRSEKSVGRGTGHIVHDFAYAHALVALSHSV